MTYGAGDTCAVGICGKPAIIHVRTVEDGTLYWMCQEHAGHYADEGIVTVIPDYEGGMEDGGD